MSVKTLLDESMALHRSAKPVSKGTGRASDSKAKWAQAYAKRMEAQALDPDHEDPAWEDEKVPHFMMIQFYEFQLGIGDHARQDLQVSRPKPEIKKVPRDPPPIKKDPVKQPR